MMKPSHYNCIGTIIKNTFNKTYPTPEETLAASDMRDVIVMDIVDYLSKQNPRFNREKFLIACGYMIGD